MGGVFSVQVTCKPEQDRFWFAATATDLVFSSTDMRLMMIPLTMSGGTITILNVAEKPSVTKSLLRNHDGRSRCYKIFVRDLWT
ncbi:hypothetical protein OROGR_029096 [Orobanche gracilis]